MLPRNVPGAFGTQAAREVSSSMPLVGTITSLGIPANGPFICAVRMRRDAVNGLVARLDATPVRSMHAIAYDVGETYQWSTYNWGTNQAYINRSGAPQGEWVSVIMEIESTTARRYILNGSAGTSATLVGPMTGNIDTIKIGGEGASASVAQVALFAGTASDALIAQHRQGVHPSRLPGALVECWDLDRVGPIAGLVRGTWLAPTGGATLTAGPSIQGPPTLRRFFFGPMTGGGAGAARRRRFLLCGSR